MTPPSSQALVLIDDERTFVNLLGELLQNTLRCPIHVFTRAEDALAALPDLQPGLVVTDYCMPDMDGLELLRRIQSVLPDLPCVMITGHTIGLDDEELGTLTCLRSVLYKPFSSRKLADEIVRLWPHAAAPLAKV